jgi:hypothetical protein
MLDIETVRKIRSAVNGKTDEFLSLSDACRIELVPATESGEYAKENYIVFAIQSGGATILIKGNFDEKEKIVFSEVKVVKW